MIADGLVEVGPEMIEVTPAGRLLVRNVAMSFDAYLGTHRGGHPLFEDRLMRTSWARPRL